MERFARFIEELIKNMLEGLVEKETRPFIEAFFKDHATPITIGVWIAVAAIVLAVIIAKMKKAS
jgi:hypothetical protein